jgi:Putative DNA-binding domain
MVYQNSKKDDPEARILEEHNRKYKFIINKPVKEEETRHNEFKEIKSANPINRVRDESDEYVVAFLNREGGTIFFGITDSERRAVGVPLTSQERDRLNRIVTDKLITIKPSISPAAYRIDFHHLYEDETCQKKVEDRPIVAIEVDRPIFSDYLYSTASGDVFMKTDSGKKKLSKQEIEDELRRRQSRRNQISSLRLRPQAKVFISSNEQTLAVQELRELLKKRSEDKVVTWSRSSDVSFGCNEWASIQESIEECDHFLVILSDDAPDSILVRRELGIAMRFRRERHNLYPTIIGVRPDRSCDLLFITPIDPETLQSEDVPYNISETRCLRLTHPFNYREIDHLIDQLVPKITFLDSSEDAEGSLLDNSIACYEALFPDSGERDFSEDIRKWLEEAKHLGPDWPWRELYAVLHLGERVIGIAYLSIHVPERWFFGNYFGVLPGFRRDNRGESLWKELLCRAQEMLCKARETNDGAKGILFEVEPIDMVCLQGALLRGTILGTDSESDVIENLRRLRRLFLFQLKGAYVVLDSDGEPLPYWQPAMTEPLDASQERRFILMCLPKLDSSSSPFDTSDAIQFIYENLYMDTYGGTGEVEIAGFREYIQSLRHRVEKKAKGSYLGKCKIPRGLYSGLIKIARKERILARLAL